MPSTFTVGVERLDLEPREAGTHVERGLEAVLRPFGDGRQRAVARAAPHAPGGHLCSAVPARVHRRPAALAARGRAWRSGGPPDPLLDQRPVGEIRAGEDSVEDELPVGRELRDERHLAPADEHVAAGQRLHAPHVLRPERLTVRELLDHADRPVGLVELELEPARTAIGGDVLAGAGDLAAVVVEQGHGRILVEDHVMLPLELGLGREVEGRALAPERPLDLARLEVEEVARRRVAHRHERLAVVGQVQPIDVVRVPGESVRRGLRLGILHGDVLQR